MSSLSLFPPAATADTPKYASWRRAIGRFVFAALACLASEPALAQAYQDWAGTPVPGVVPIPYAFTPVSPGQHNIPLTSSTALALPLSARYATICGSGATVRYTTDGTTTPTSAIGQPLAAGTCVSLSGRAALANFRAISTTAGASATGTLDVEYFR